MKFYSLLDQSTTEEFESAYKTAREIGILRYSEDTLFFKNKRKVYYIPFTEIHRCFRRVMGVPMKFCCGKGELAVENLVICDKEDKEIAQIQLPGTKAAQILMEELKTKMPDVLFVKP
ncbi:MAG: hypothetical protein MJ097_06915 [Dorea sp.]|nr:hypothetical protein [Dorea sp.]